MFGCMNMLILHSILKTKTIMLWVYSWSWQTHHPHSLISSLTILSLFPLDRWSLLWFQLDLSLGPSTLEKDNCFTVFTLNASLVFRGYMGTSPGYTSACGSHNEHVLSATWHFDDLISSKLVKIRWAHVC